MPPAEVFIAKEDSFLPHPDSTAPPTATAPPFAGNRRPSTASSAPLAGNRRPNAASSAPLAGNRRPNAASLAPFAGNRRPSAATAPQSEDDAPPIGAPPAPTPFHVSSYKKRFAAAETVGVVAATSSLPEAGGDAPTSRPALRKRGAKRPSERRFRPVKIPKYRKKKPRKQEKISPFLGIVAPTPNF